MFDLADIIHKKQKEKFNKAKIEIYSDRTYSEYYWWDSGLQKQDLLNYAGIFFQWANDRMMSMIFEYEKDNNLVPTQYDTDGDLEYLSSWDSRVFTFHINDKQEIFSNMKTDLRESILGQGNANRFDLFEQAINNKDSNLYKIIEIQ